MATDNRKQNNQPNSSGKQNDSLRSNQPRQDKNSEQIGRLESQPGNMSGVNIEGQRSRDKNQDLASRGTDKEHAEDL